jgi:hypothetical protein
VCIAIGKCIVEENKPEQFLRFNQVWPYVLFEQPEKIFTTRLVLKVFPCRILRLATERSKILHAAF